MPDPSSPLSQAIAAELQTLNETVGEDVTNRAKAKKTLQALLKALEANDVDSLGKLLSKPATLLIQVYPEAKSTVEKIQADLKRRRDEQVRAVCLQVEQYCKEKSISLKGNAPKYTVDFFVDIHIDQKTNRVKVGTQSLQTLKWTPIQVAIESERERLWHRPFSTVAFRDKVIQAYQELEHIKPSAAGWAGLEEIYQLLKQAMQEVPGWKQGGRLIAYYKDEFGVDLSRLLEAQASRSIPPPFIELSAIRDPRRAYRILRPDHNIDEYGFLRLKEA